jgi:hypothetical protein
MAMDSIDFSCVGLSTNSTVCPVNYLACGFTSLRNQVGKAANP